MSDRTHSRHRPIEGPESVERLQSILDAAIDAIITIDRFGIISSANSAVEHMFGYQVDELVGQNVSLLMPPPDATHHDRYIERYLQTGEARIIGIGREVVGKRRDGSTFPVDLAIGEFAHDGKAMFTGIVRDISDRKQVEQSLTDLGRLIDTSLNEIYIFESQTLRFVLVNRGAILNLGYSLTELLAMTPLDIKPAFSPERFAQLLAPLRSGERDVVVFDTYHQRQDGTRYDVSVHVQPTTYLNRPCFVGFALDTTERNATAERLRQADRLASIGTLAAGLGHDMNNVLLPVRARLDVIESLDLPPAATKQYDEIRKSAKYLQDLADGLHLLALDPDDAEASTGTTAIHQWWQQVHSLLGRALPKTVRFSASLPSHMPEIPVAPHRLTQAVLNLLVNAGTAVAENGRVRLWAEVDDDQEVVRLGISDDGCGMTEEVRRRAFEPFFTTKSRGLGTGLGLSLVHGVVMAAGGSIDVDSHPGTGTSITLKFPSVGYRDMADPQHVEHESPVAAVSIEGTRHRSLVENLLQIAGLDVISTDAVGTSTRPMLWVLDAASGIRAAQSAVESSQHVIVVGPVDLESWPEGPTYIDNPNDFDALRSSIDRAINGPSS